MKAKAPAIVCALLAGTFGFSSLAAAQDWSGRRGGDGPRAERREDRFERRQERRHIQAHRQDRQVQRAYNQGYRQGYQQPQYGHGYSAPRYDSQPRFQRGGYLPHEYRQRHYYVNDWRGHRGLYAPPHGHQWMQVGTDFVLVALATGLIANLLIN